MSFAVPGGEGTAAGVSALATALLGFSQAVGLGKDSCSSWEIWIKFLDNCLKAAVCGEAAGVFSPSQNLHLLKANNNHVGLRFMQKFNGIMLV